MKLFKYNTAALTIAILGSLFGPQTMFADGKTPSHRAKSRVKAKAPPEKLPKPDKKDKPDTKKPLKVYILAGQSNMCGMGKVNTLKPLPANDERFQYLVDDKGQWSVRNDVFFMNLAAKSSRRNYAWLTVGVRDPSNQLVGPEVGFGHVVGYYHDEAVLIIKAAIGNTSLKHDWVGPTSRKRLDQATPAGQDPKRGYILIS
jgi:hypothetical protein